MIAAWCWNHASEGCLHRRASIGKAECYCKNHSTKEKQDARPTGYRAGVSFRVPFSKSADTRTNAYYWSTSSNTEKPWACMCVPRFTGSEIHESDQNAISDATSPHVHAIAYIQLQLVLGSSEKSLPLILLVACRLMRAHPPKLFFLQNCRYYSNVSILLSNYSKIVSQITLNSPYCAGASTVRQIIEMHF